MNTWISICATHKNRENNRFWGSGGPRGQSHFYGINYGTSAKLLYWTEMWCLSLENGVDKINLAEL